MTDTDLRRVPQITVRGRYDDLMDALPLAPRQRRARVKVARMLEVAESFIDNGGIDRFTTADVAREAGVSIGLVYRYFADRVAILDALRPDRHHAAEQRDIALRLLAEARASLRYLADGGRLDEFSYHELACHLDDAPTDANGRDMVALVDIGHGGGAPRNVGPALAEVLPG